jgi:hypothetical protein
MSNEWTIYVLLGCVIVLMFRLDRLGRQVEAVCFDIKYELSPSEDRREEMLSERKSMKAEAAKEKRQQLIGGGIVLALLVGWFIFTRH